MKLDVPAIPFARAWEAVISAAGNDSGRTNTYRVVCLELFQDHGIRLISADGYLSARAWIPINDTEDALEPELGEDCDERFVIVDNDYRGLGLLKHARKLLKATWQLKAKDQEPDTSPKLRIEVRTPARVQGVLEGMDEQLFFIDFPDHEVVALTVSNAEFVDWRSWGTNAVTPVETMQVGVDQLVRIAKIAKLYPTYPIEWFFHGDADTVGVVVGPIRGVMKTASAIALDKSLAEQAKRVAEQEEIEAAYDEDDEDLEDDEADA